MGFSDWESVNQTFYGPDANKVEKESGCVAKIIHYSGVDKYYIREGREGLLNVKNVVGDYDVKISGMDKERYSFSQVAKDSFFLYLDYLTTKTENLLKGAEKIRRINV